MVSHIYSIMPGPSIEKFVLLMIHTAIQVIYQVSEYTYGSSFTVLYRLVYLSLCLNLTVLISERL